MLNTQAAKIELLKLMDRKNPLYLGDVVTNEEAANRVKSQWADAFYNCAVAIIPPSTTVAAAKAAFISAMTGFENDKEGKIFQLACKQFANNLGTGMIGFTANPPVSDFNPVGGSKESASAAAEYMANEIYKWLSTGTAINNNSGATINWS